MEDMVPFNQIEWVNVPRGFESYEKVSDITAIHMRPGQNNGLSFEFDRSKFPPDFVPVGWDGPIQYTVCAGFNINGRWIASGFIQMWEDRPSTGAPIIAQWADWAYDRNRWGDLVGYRPKAGDKILLMIAAGNARQGSQGDGAYTKVPYRTNIVIVELPEGDFGDFSFSGSVPVPVPTEPKDPNHPNQPPIDTVNIVGVDKIIAYLITLQEQLDIITSILREKSGVTTTIKLETDEPIKVKIAP